MAITPDQLRKAYDKGLENVKELIDNELKELKQKSEKPKNHPPSNHSNIISNEFNTSLPSVRYLQNTIRSKEEVEIKLVTGDIIRGTLKWLDNNCICVNGTSGGQNHNFLIWQHAIATIKNII